MTPFDVIRPHQRQFALQYEVLGHMLLPELTSIDSTLNYHMGADLDGVGFYVGNDPREMVEVSLLKECRWRVGRYPGGSVELPSHVSIEDLARAIYDRLPAKEIRHDTT